MKDIRLELIEAIEKISFLPKVSIKVLRAIAMHDAPLPTRMIAEMSGLSHPHANFVLNKLLKQEVISKAKTLFPISYWMIDKDWEKRILTIYRSTSLYENKVEK